MKSFDHEKLDVYRIAIQFVAFAAPLCGNLPRGQAYLADQLRGQQVRSHSTSPRVLVNSLRTRS